MEDQIAKIGHLIQMGIRPNKALRNISFFCLLVRANRLREKEKRREEKEKKKKEKEEEEKCKKRKGMECMETIV